MVAVLSGYPAPTWANIRHMLDNRTFKIELSMIDVKKLTRKQVSTVRRLRQQHRHVTINNISQVSVPAATLLSWVEGLLVWHAGRNLIRIAPSPHESIPQVLEAQVPLKNSCWRRILTTAN